MKHAPRTKAHEALTEAEMHRLRAHADALGGWNPLARAWPELGGTTLRRIARGEAATPLVLHVARQRIASDVRNSAPPRAA